MARLSFAVFALASLALWVAQLLVVSPSATSAALEDAAHQAARAGAGLAQRLAERRLEIVRSALHAGTSEAVVRAAQVARDPRAIPAQVFEDVRAALLPELPETWRAQAVLGFRTEAGVVYARGSEAPSEDSARIDVEGVSRAGTSGILQTLSGQSFLFVSLPVYELAVEGLRPSRRPRAGPGLPSPVKVLGTVFVGAPFLSDAVVDGVARDGAFDAVGVTLAGRLLAAGGAGKARLEAVNGQVAVGRPWVVERAAVASLGPVGLPLFTAGAGSPTDSGPRRVALRAPVPSSAYEVVVVTSLEPSMRALANGQRLTLVGGAGLLVLAVLGFLGVGSSRSRSPVERTMSGTELAPAAQVATDSAPLELPPEPMTNPGQLAAEGVLAATTPSSDTNPALDAAASPGWGGEQLQSADAPLEQASAQPWESSAGDDRAMTDDATRVLGTDELERIRSGDEPTDATAEAYALPDSAPAYQNGAESPSSDQTAPYIAGIAGLPEWAMPASESQPSQQPWQSAEGEAQPPELPPEEPTAFASPPHQLLQEAAQAAPPEELAPEDSDEAEIRAVFDEFIATRQRCGEGADALSFEKFSLKLKKNREQLIQKYNCRTVRFHVYVKEGKAALKATPVND